MTTLDYEVVALFGPTASGKSAVAQSLAARLGTEVVSADALQVYRGLPILTNQPDTPTRLVAIRDLHETMSMGEYAELAHDAIDDLVGTRGCAVVAGGTGLYLRAAVADLDVPPAAGATRRRRFEQLYDADRDAALELLDGVDPAAAAAVHPNDRRRIVRALELADAGSSLVPTGPRLWAADTRRPTLVVGLDVPAAELRRRIEARTDGMIAQGAAAEVESALRGPISPTAAKALGLEELASLPLEAARERLVARTTQYAAYQRKWMRRISGIAMIDADRPPGEVVDAILDLARAR